MELIVLTDQEKQMLKSVARHPFDANMGKENPRLDAMTTSIKLINPKAFLTDADLPNRRFFHKPNLNIPFLSFIEEKV
jgi:hypothetical protein